MVNNVDGPSARRPCGATQLARGCRGQRAAILERLQQAGAPTTIAGLAAELGVHQNTVREHLDALVDRGLAVRGRAPAHGRGRPAWTYTATTGNVEPDQQVRDYAGLATALAAHIARDQRRRRRRGTAGRPGMGRWTGRRSSPRAAVETARPRPGEQSSASCRTSGSIRWPNPPHHRRAAPVPAARRRQVVPAGHLSGAPGDRPRSDGRARRGPGVHRPAAVRRAGRLPPAPADPWLTLHRRPLGRIALLLPGGVALLLGLDAGLLLLGLPAPLRWSRLPDVHGMVMVLGFVGTVVALERAVALRRTWGYLAPAGFGVGALLLVSAAPAPVGGGVLVLGAAALVAVYVPLWRRQPAGAVVVQAGGGVLALGAALPVMT